MSDSNTSTKEISDRLFIFSVRIPLLDGKTHKSSVSMDGFLAECLIGVLGNYAEATKWVETHAIQIREAAQDDRHIRRVGVSRLVQREALKLVLKNRHTTTTG
jgi:hypothetical protein